jgi:hypothetical protein
MLFTPQSLRQMCNFITFLTGNKIDKPFIWAILQMLLQKRAAR